MQKKRERRLFRWSMIIASFALSLILLVNMALAASVALASPAGDAGDDFFDFPLSDAGALETEFQTGNFFLFADGATQATPLPSTSDGTVSSPSTTDGSPSDSAIDEEGDDSIETTEPDAEVVATIARVVGSGINMRAAASTDSEIIAQLDDGVTLNITGKSGEWLQVTFGILQGYVHGMNLYQVTDNGQSGYIMRDSINLREQSNTDSAVLDTINAGTGVQVKDYVNGWYQVVYNGKTGFVRSDCITVNGPYDAAKTTLLKSGMSGAAVTKAQNELKRRGFFSGIVNGTFDDSTEKAVEAFQAMANVDSDGVLGVQTLAVLYGNNNYYLRVSIAQKSGVKGKVKMTPWDTVKTILPNGATIKVIDVRTGVSWKEKVSCGHYHKDVCPLTSADTAKLKSVYGGKWTWARRPVWVIYKNYVWAASMNGMPHASHLSVVSGNNFSGVHCIHFLNSRVHASGKIDPAHQACIKYAYNAGK